MNPAKEAPTYFWTLVYKVKAIIPGEIAANKTQAKNIELNLIYNFDRKTADLNNILIDKNNNKNVNDVLKNFIFKKNNLQNRVYLKNLLNRAVKSYAG